MATNSLKHIPAVLERGILIAAGNRVLILKFKVMETRVYSIDCDLAEDKNILYLTDDEFIAEAEKQGTVYSLKSFQDDWNFEDLNYHNSFIRILTIKS